MRYFIACSFLLFAGCSSHSLKSYDLTTTAGYGRGGYGEMGSAGFNLTEGKVYGVMQSVHLHYE